jgi:hypothetical protein
MWHDQPAAAAGLRPVFVPAVVRSGSSEAFLLPRILKGRSAPMNKWRDSSCLYDYPQLCRAATDPPQNFIRDGDTRDPPLGVLSASDRAGTDGGCSDACDFPRPQASLSFSSPSPRCAAHKRPSGKLTQEQCFRSTAVWSQAWGKGLLWGKATPGPSSPAFPRSGRSRRGAYRARACFCSSRSWPIPFSASL